MIKKNKIQEKNDDIELTSSLPEPLWNIVKALRTKIKLIVLIGDLNEIFSQNYQYLTITNWLSSLLKNIEIIQIIDNSYESIVDLFKENTNKSMLLLNCDILFNDVEKIIAIIEQRLKTEDIKSPLILNFSGASNIPEDLYIPHLLGCFIHIQQLSNEDPSHLLEYFMEKHNLSVSFDEIRPALTGLSNQDILYSLTRIKSFGEQINYQSILKQKLWILRSKYNKLGNPFIPQKTINSLLIDPQIKDLLKNLIKKDKKGGFNKIKRVAFYGYKNDEVIEAFANELNLMCIKIDNLIQDTLNETKRIFDLLSELIFSNFRCALIFNPIELIIPLDKTIKTNYILQYVNKRLFEIFDKMATSDSCNYLFIGTNAPDELGLELNMKFAYRIPILPIISKEKVLSMIQEHLSTNKVKVVIPQPDELPMMTSFHFECIIEEITSRIKSKNPIDKTIWKVLPPFDTSYNSAESFIKWSNLNI